MKNTILFILCAILTLMSQNIFAQSASLSTAIQELKLESVCEGDATIIELTTTTNNLNFQWEVRENRYFHPIEMDDERFSGANTQALQIVNADARMDFRCVLSEGTASIKTAPIRLNINNPVIRRQPADKIAYLGDNFSMTMVATGLFLNYQWEIAKDGNWVSLANGQQYQGVEQPTLVIREVKEVHEGAQFRCIVTGGDCGQTETIISEVGTLTVSSEISPLKSMVVNPGTVTWYSNQQKTYVNGNPTIFINGSLQVTGKIVNDPVTSNYFFLAQDGNDMYVTGNITNDGFNTDTNPNYLVNQNTHLFHPVTDKTTLIMAGSTDAVIDGTSDLTSVYHLKTEKAANTNKVDINHDIHIRSQVEFGTGDINLNGQELELDFTPDNIVSVNVHPTLTPGTASQFPTLINETEDNRIIDSAPSLTQGGVWVGQRLDNNFGSNGSSPFASGFDFGNIGLGITANGTGGATTSFAADSVSLYRRLLPVAVNSTLNSIDRFYLMDKENPILGTDEFGVQVSYLDNDLSQGEDENGFSIYYNETNVVDYDNIAPDNVDISADNVSANSVADIEGYWTIAECPDTPQISFSNASTDICWAETATIAVNLTGGTAATYQWSLDGVLNAETSSSFTITGSPDSLATQNIEVIVISNFGCRAVLTHVINHLQTPFVDLGADAYLCESQSITLDALNNLPSTTYAWTVDGVASGTNQTYTYAATGSTMPVEIIAAVTNSLGCTRFDTIMVTEAVSPMVDLGVDQTVCATGATINLDATPTNIIAGDLFDYDWSTTEATATINPSVTATNSVYTVTVTNTVTSCSSVANMTALLSDISLSTSHVNVDCFGASTGSIDLTATSTETTATFSYQWSDANGAYATTEDLLNIPVGDYNVVVTDNFNCTETLSLPVTIIQPAAALSASPAVTDVSCNGLSDGLISANPGGGTAPYTFLWSTNATSQDINTLTAGTYSLTITDANGCTTEFTEMVTEPTAITATLTPTNVICNGDATGSIDVVVSGGMPNYTFLWSDNSTAEDLSNVVAGTYTVTITDMNGCIAEFTETITENAAITFDVQNVLNISCNGANDGSITLDNTATGTAGMTFLWVGQNTGALAATGNMVTGLVPDTYDVTVTNADNCTETFSFSITEPTVLDVTGVSIVDAAGCVDNGAIDITVVGGTPTYTYAWSNGATTQDIGSLGGGSYSVTITDANACTYTNIYTVNAPNGIMLTETQTNVSCNGLADGSLSVAVSGGTPSYTYAWTLANGSMTSTSAIANLIPGNYQLVVTDNAGCTTSNIYVITEPALLTVGGTETNVSCNAADDGSIQTTIVGGTMPYTYLWSANASSATTSNVNNLSPDTYSVTVTDANGCIANQSFMITEPTILVTNPTVVTELNCFNDIDAVVDAGASGGTMPYSYQWDGGPNTEFYSGIGGGTYEVTVTDANGCTVANTVTVIPPTSIDITLTNQINVSVFGGSDGAIDITVSGGVPGTNPAYTFEWTNSVGTIITTTEDPSGLSADTYTVVVTDGNSCTETASYTIIEANLLEVTLDNTTDVSCNGGNDGTINVTVTGGVMPYTYTWSTTTNNSYSALEDLSNLLPETYALLVTDANGATVTLSPNVTIIEPTLIMASTTIFEVLCNSGNDGSITIATSGGTPPYNYTWSNGAANSNQNSSLIAGIYSVTITDANNCTTNVQNITVNEPVAILISGVVTNATSSGASDGAIDITVTGGTTPYSYDWDNDNTIGDSDPEDINGLVAGTYNVIVTDANGCTANMSFIVDDPDPLLITIDAANDPLCNGDMTGSILVSITGGVMPYTYAWDNGATTEDLMNISAGTYDLTVTDANNITQTLNIVLSEPTVLSEASTIMDASCFGGNDGSIQVTASGGTPPYNYAWSNSATTSGNIGLTAGSYSLTISDANSCEFIQTYTINEPSDIVITSIETNVTIFGSNDGAIDLTVSGGTPNYTHLWSNGSTTEDLMNITAGSYTVTVTDVNSCIQTATFNITEPTALVAALNSSSNVTCNGAADGTIDIDVSGAVPPYTFVWTNGDMTEDLTNLIPGTYQVTVTDANGAVASLSTSVIITEPTELTDNPATITNVSCNGGNDGNIAMNPTGGTPPYAYTWANGLGNNPAINNLSAGDYTVTITDANNCVIVRTNTVTEPTLLTVSDVITDVTIFGQATGAVDITPVGGTPAYSYLWSNSATTEDIAGVVAGTYNVTITDANNCTVTDTYIITEPNVLLVTTNTSIDPSCNGFADGSLSVTVIGGVLPYIYDWDNDGVGDNDDSDTLTGLTVGVYNLTVIDNNGAIATHTITLSEPTVLSSSESSQNISCNGGSDGSVAVTGNSGTAPYSIIWNDGSSNLINSGLVAGTYDYTLTDAQGCMVFNSLTITEPAILSTTESIQDATCDSFGDGEIALSTVGGTTPYSYIWSNGTTNAIADNLIAGTYDVTLTDANSCSLTATYTVNQPAPITITLTTSNNANCGQADGSITVAATGGTAPFTYQWVNPLVIGSTLPNIPSGAYGVIVTDAQGCTASQTFTISDIAGPVLAIDAQTNVDCFGENTGAISTSLSSGTAPFTYLWSNGETTTDLSNLTADVYSLTVTDAVGCSATLSTDILQNDELTANIISTNVSCFQGQDGTADLSVIGGVTPYTFAWSNGETMEDLANLTIGTYEVTVTDDLGCSTTTDVTLTEPTEVTYAELITPVTCFEANDGAIDLTFNGGVAPYDFAWSDVSTNTSNRTGLSGGVYDVTVTDQNSCETILSLIVPEPLEILLTITTTDSQCFGDNSGSLDVQVANGSGNFLYFLLDTDTGAPVSQQVNNPLFIDLAPANYSISVSELNGNFCSSQITYFTITESPELVTTITNTPVSCGGAMDGSLDLGIQGGTPDYTVDWSNGESGILLSNLAEGIYSATITDANNCLLVVTDTIVEPDSIVIVATIDSISCIGAFDGEIVLSINGGSGNFNYAWSTGQNVDSLSNLGIGDYEVTVSEVGNPSCTSIASFTLVEPDALEITNAQITEASCGGTATGAIDITLIGGTLPYSFDWTDDAGVSVSTMEDLTNSSTGNFTVVITDANGCTATESYFIDSQASVQVSLATIDVSCAGLSNGEAMLTVTGGSGSYTFNWSSVLNPTEQNQTGLIAGDYDVTVNDANGSCEQILTVTINEPDPIVVSNQMVMDISCAGTSTGSFSFTVNGGPTGNFVFNWTNSDGTFSDQTLVPTISNLPADTYTVTSSDSPCSFVEEFTISELDLLSATVDVMVANCSSIVTVTSTGGVAPYNYTISPDPNGSSGTNNIFDGLPANTYSLTITDDVGCQITDMFVVEENADISVTPNVTEITCAGAMDGSIELVAADPNLQFAWNTGAPNTNLIENLDAGNYEVTITNDEGCTEELSFTLNQPQAIVIDTVSYSSDICFGLDEGEITIGITGGNNPSIEWSNGVMNQTSITGLAPGNYNVIVGEGGCEVTADFVINSLPEIQISLVTSTDPTCGQNNGYLEIMASGGNPSTYSYNWSGGVPNDMEFIENLDAGDYTITVTDGNMCSAMASYTLNAPNALTATAEVTNVICFGANDGTITMTASGGIGALSYSIDGMNYQPNADFTGLSGGTYTATVQDDDGCTFTAGTFDITEPTSTLVVSGTPMSNSGVGIADGSIDLIVSGGETPYTYLWSNGLTTEDLMSLVEGDYTVTVTDNRGCEAVETYTVTTSSSGVMSISTNLTDISCFDANDGELEVVITGGVAPYSITWTYPNNSTVLDQDTIQNLTPGMYSVEVVDANNLMANEGMLVLTNPSGLTGSVSTIDACEGLTNGILVFNINGGTLPYTYEFITGGTPTSIMDNDVDIDSIPNLAPATYTNIMVTDANDCSIMLTDQMITESAGITISVDMQNDVSCNGLMDGNVSISAMGGVVSGNYNYAWTDDNGMPVGSVNNLSNLTAGTYTILVSDDVGCGQTEQIVINEPDSIAVNATSSNVACFNEANGSISVSGFTGGSGSDYTWIWEDGSVDLNDRPNLIAGNYSLTVTDGNTCTKTIDFNITQPSSALSLEIGVENEFCFGENNGFISTLVTGGTMPYDYLWSNDESTELIIDLTPGMYSLVVTDDNGCQVDIDTIIAPAEEFLVSYSSINPTCFGFNDGSIDLTVLGGVPDYNFNWGGIFSEDLANLSADSYSVTITYNNDLCEHIEAIELIEPVAITIAPQADSVSCNGVSDGLITLNAQGGTGTLNYNWSTGSTSDVIDNLVAGEYNVTISDDNNCMVTLIDTIFEPALLIVSAEIQRAGCKLQDDGSIELDIEGGTAPFTFDWSNGVIDQNATNLVSNSYQVTVWDANDCMVEQDLLVAAADTIFTAKFLAASGLFDVDSVQVNSDEVIHFRDVSYPNPIEWNWSFGDSGGLTSTEASPAFSYPDNPAEEESEYLAKLIVSNQFCTDSLEKSIRITNNLRLIAPEQDSIVYLNFTEMIAYPNPTSDEITINIGLTREEGVELTVFDALGKLVWQKELSDDDLYEETINVQHLPSGIYFIRAKALNRVHTLKMIVDK